jgi:hypothetical protein
LKLWHSALVIAKKAAEIARAGAGGSKSTSQFSGVFRESRAGASSRPSRTEREGRFRPTGAAYSYQKISPLKLETRGTGTGTGTGHGRPWSHLVIELTGCNHSFCFHWHIPCNRARHAANLCRPCFRIHGSPRRAAPQRRASSPERAPARWCLQSQGRSAPSSARRCGWPCRSPSRGSVPGNPRRTSRHSGGLGASAASRRVERDARSVPPGGVHAVGS